MSGLKWWEEETTTTQQQENNTTATPPYLVKGLVCDKHCMIEFMKQVLPKLCKPRLPIAPCGDNALLPFDSSRSLCNVLHLFLCTDQCDT